MCRYGPFAVLHKGGRYAGSVPVKPSPPEEPDDGRVSLAPLTAEQALRGLLAVDLEGEPVGDDEDHEPPHGE